MTRLNRNRRNDQNCRVPNIAGLAFALMVVVTFVAGAGSQSAIATPVQNPVRPDPVHLYVISTTVSGGQRCSWTGVNRIIDLATAVENLASARLPAAAAYSGVRLEDYDPASPSSFRPPPDVLLKYINPMPTKPTYVALATLCRTGDVTNIVITGYQLATGKKPSSGSVTGTFDALETADPASWANLFGTNNPPLPVFIPNVAFLPVGNDPNNVVNPRLLRNLPITAVATPPPLAPPAPGSPPPPTPPPTRLGMCQASTDRIYIAGRIVITSASNDISRAILAGGSLKWTQVEWSAYYTSAGLIAGLLYNPNSAEVSVDVFVCPPKAVGLKTGLHNHGTTSDGTDEDDMLRGFPYEDAAGKHPEGRPDTLYQVGGLGHHITGHRTTPSIGTDPFAAGHALDSAVLDLENQLDCIIVMEQVKMGQPKNELGDDLTHSAWCMGGTNTPGYFKTLEASNPDALVAAPVDAGLRHGGPE